MIGNWQTGSVLLGAAGGSPGVDIYRIDSGQSERLITLPVGESVYSLDIAPDGNDLAIGTKAGGLYWYNGGSVDGNVLAEPARKLEQGSPILAVCFMSQREMVVSDLAGRCLLWVKEQDLPGKTIFTSSHKVYSLHKLNEQCLVGLSTEGKLLFWSWPGGNLTRDINVPSLLLHRIARLISWPAAHALAWPGPEGKLALYDPDKENLRFLPAHTGDFYAMATCAEYLVTVGKDDGCLKLWQAALEKPVFTGTVPEGTISAAAWSDKHIHLLLINESGQTSLYELKDRKELQFSCRLTGGDHRIAISPDPAALKSLLKQQRAAKARQLTGEIQEKLARNQLDGLEGLHDQLIKSGYRSVSLYLQAEIARYQEDIITELRVCHELTNLLPANNARTIQSLERYALLLEKVWQIPEALAVYKRIAAMEIAPKTEAKINSLTSYREALDGGSSVIESEVPLPELIQSATAIGKPFTGRFLLKARAPLPCRDVTITVKDLVEKYEYIRKDEPTRALSPAQRECAHWITTEQIEPIDIITFKYKTNSPISNFQLGFKILTAGLQSVIVPVELFCIEQMDATMTVEHHNKFALASLNQPNMTVLFNSWTRMVKKRVVQAIQRLITMSLGSRK